MSRETTSETADWEAIFPFEPYEDQRNGIEQTLKTLCSNGIHILEGPCGTGKTLIALTAGLSLIRDRSTPFQRALVITSKKQQLKAFESDFKTINAHVEKPFYGLSLVGKSDLCPYVQDGQIDSDNIYHKCISLRDNTHRLMIDAVRKKRASSESKAAFGLEYYGHPDPVEGEELTIRGKPTPYQESIPSVGDIEYCPFYASHVTNTVKDEFPLDLRRVTTGEEILSVGAQEGTCPHIEMRRLHGEADILFGNYKHCFDPATVGGLTNTIIDEHTLLICDEAHGVVEEVRDQLSYELSFSRLLAGIRNINQVHRWVNGKGNNRKCMLAQSILSNTELKSIDFEVASNFLSKVSDILRDKITENLEAEYGNDWVQACENRDHDEISIPLQKPDAEAPDAVSQWADTHGYDDIWERFLKVSKLTDVIKDVVARKVEKKSPDGSFPISDVHEILQRWLAGDHTEYFREIKLNRRQSVDNDPPKDRPWRVGYYATIQINNCIPQNEIAATLDSFGGALLMSATLSPIDVYEEVTGVSKLKKGTHQPVSLVTKAIANSKDGDEGDSNAPPEERTPNLETLDSLANVPEEPPKERRRVVNRSVFELSFPKENRITLAVDAPKFTYSNRWPPEKSQRLRSIYEKVICDVVRSTPGNVLVMMPSYGEAEWASSIIEDNPYVSKNVLTDTSSSDSATDQIKKEFFDGEPKVLTTSLRGTLTEGVDFDGDKLHGIVICGVPITNTSSDLAQAVEAAYDDRFGGDGFEYAFTIPAIRKTRQALGRVIRGSSDVGCRVLVDERYVTTSSFSSVKQHFPDYEADEFITVFPNDVIYELEDFWRRQ